MEIPLAHWIQWTNKIPMDISRSIGSIGSNGHFRLAISMAEYLHEVHGLVITSFKYTAIDQLKKHRWKFHLSIGSNGQTKFQWTFPGPLDPMDTFVWLSQWHSIYMRSMGLSLRHSNTWDQLKK